jgi:microcystin-dependent protein
VAENYANDAVTSLAGSITAGATSLTVVSSTGFPAANFRIRIDAEIMLVTAVSGTTWTVTRAVEAVAGQQVATAHSSGATVGHVLTAASIALAGGTGLIPSGALMPYAGSSTPPGFLSCDGSAVSRTTYAGLFSAIGTTWGAGDGSTTFNLPDLRDRVVIGTSPGSLSGNRPTARSLAQTGGEETHTLTTAEMPNHGHPTTVGADYGSVNFGNSSECLVSDGSGAGGLITCATTNVGGGGAHNVIQPFACAQWLIKT